MKTWIFAVLVAPILVIAAIWLLSLTAHTNSNIAVAGLTHSVKYEFRDLSEVCGPKTSKEVSKFIDDSKSCVFDEDCTIIEGAHCPYGCTISINKQYEEIVDSMLHEVIETVERVCGRSCVYRCRAAGDVICKNQKCTTLSGVRKPPPSFPKKPPVPKYEG
jgi:hypothetical protein